MITAFCDFHGKEEICPSEPYKVCLGCYHLFQTEEGLLAAYNDTVETPTNDANLVTHCPFCQTALNE